MKKFFTGFLIGLATVLGLLVGTFLTLLKYRVYRDEANARAAHEIDTLRETEKEAEGEYQKRVLEIESKLVHAEMDSVVNMFLEKFGVGGKE